MQGGTQQLSDSRLFEACIRDLANMSEPATRAFIQNVDSSLLDPIAKQVDNPTTESLNWAYTQTLQILTEDRLISDQIAREVSGALVGGVADFLNIPYIAPAVGQPAAEQTMVRTPTPASAPRSAPVSSHALDSAPAAAPTNPYAATGANAGSAANGTSATKRIGMPIAIGVVAGLAIAGVVLFVLRFSGVGTSSTSNQTNSVTVVTDSASNGSRGTSTTDESKQDVSSSSSSSSSTGAGSQEQSSKQNGVWVATKVEEWDYYSDGTDNHDEYTYGVDAGGNLTTPGVSFSYRYGDDGKLMELTETSDKNTIFHAYTYDSAGRITQERRTYSDNPCVRTYEFDQDGFVTTQHCYDEDGNYTATFNNERDAQGRVTKVSIRGVDDQSGEVKCTRTEEYTYDKNNNIEKINIEDTRYRDSGPRTITANTVRTYEYVSKPAPWLAELQTISKTGEPTTIF